MKPKAATAASRANPGDTSANVSASSAGRTARSRTNSNTMVTTTGKSKPGPIILWPMCRRDITPCPWARRPCGAPDAM